MYCRNNVSGTFVRSVLGVGVAAAFSLSLSSAASAQGAERHVFVTLNNPADHPIADLKPSDFEVVESGVKRSAARATINGAPMRVVIFVDNSNVTGPMMRDMRVGLLALIDSLPPEHEVMVMTLGSKPFVRVAATIDRKKATDSVKTLTAETGAEILLSGLLEAYDRFVRKVEDRWPVFVVISSDGGEGSAAVTGPMFNQFAANLREKNAVVHALMVSSGGGGGGMQASVLDTLAKHTGGHYDAIVASNNIPDRLKAISGWILESARKAAGVYQIDFASDAKDPNARVEVKVLRDGVAVTSVSPVRPR